MCAKWPCTAFYLSFGRPQNAQSSQARIGLAPGVEVSLEKPAQTHRLYVYVHWLRGWFALQILILMLMNPLAKKHVEKQSTPPPMSYCLCIASGPSPNMVPNVSFQGLQCVACPDTLLARVVHHRACMFVVVYAVQHFLVICKLHIGMMDKLVYACCLMGCALDRCAWLESGATLYLKLRVWAHVCWPVSRYKS